MIRLAILLLGARAIRAQGRLFIAIAAAWIILGLIFLFDGLNRFIIVTIDALGFVLFLEGIVALLATTALGVAGNRAVIAKAIGFLVLGFLIYDVPWDNNIAATTIFGIAFVIDGATRIAAAYVIRYRRHWIGYIIGATEFILAVLVWTDWPIPHRQTVPFCLGIALLASAWALIRIGLQARRLPAGESVTTMPFFAGRQWHARNRLSAGERVEAAWDNDRPLRLRVWTPMGSAEGARGQPVVNRYIAAVDGKGVVSTGHAAMELLPDLYISHYPATEIDRSPDNFRQTLDSSEINDVPGRFLPSYACEVSQWCEADSMVEFKRYNAAALRSFWAIYRRDTTYNLTSRNCSSVVALGLDAALEGALDVRYPLVRFASLVLDPNLWLLAIVRMRAESMTWTPGLVLDYARVLRRVTEGQDERWLARLRRLLSFYARPRQARQYALEE